MSQPKHLKTLYKKPSVIKKRKENKMDKKLTVSDVEKIAQVAATMQIENMPLSKQAYQNLADIATGKKTGDEVIEEIKRRYAQ